MSAICLGWRFNLVPRAFSSIKMAVGETPGQGYWNSPRIVEYFVTWHMMKWLFRRSFPASGGPVCFLQSETFIQTKRRHFIVFALRNSNELLEPLWQPWPGASPTAILNEEKALGTRLIAFIRYPSKQKRNKGVIVTLKENTVLRNQVTNFDNPSVVKKGWKKDFPSLRSLMLVVPDNLIHNVLKRYWVI